MALAQEVKSHGRTMLAQKRLWTLWQCVGNVADLDGCAAEVGSYRGGSAYFIAASFVARLGKEVPMEVIDTFEGHSPGKLSDRDSPIHTDGTKFLSTSYESVVEYLAGFEEVSVRKGEFSAVAPGLPERIYRLVHVDVDLYVPTWTVFATSARVSSWAGSSSSTITARLRARVSEPPRRSTCPAVASRPGTRGAASWCS